MTKLTKPFNVPSYKTEEIKDLVNDLGKIPFGSLVGNILSSCVDAQTHAATTAWNYTQQVLEHREPIVFNFQDEEGTKSISVPLFTIVPLPYLKLDNIDINIDAEASIDTEKSEEFLITVNNKVTEGNTTNVVQGTANMHIDINAGTTDMPAGLSMLLQYINGGLVVKDKIMLKPAKIYHGKIIGVYYREGYALVELFPNIYGVLDKAKVDWDWRHCKTMYDTGLKVGDECDVKIIHIDEDTNKPPLLSIRDIFPRPKNYIEDPDIVNAVYHGRIATFVQDGAIVEILPGKNGFLSIDEIDRNQYQKLEVDDDIDVKLISIDKKTGRRYLSHKVLDPKPGNNPNTPDPGTTDPGTTDPGTTDPGTTDPGTTDPGTTGPGTTGSSSLSSQRNSGSADFKKLMYNLRRNAQSIPEVITNLSSKKKVRMSTKSSAKKMNYFFGNTIDNANDYIGAPLTAYHVNWTKPVTLQKGADWQYQMEDFDVLSTILSALLWRKFNGPITLYTDATGLEYYKRMEMTSLWNGGINTDTLDDIPTNIPADIFWAAGKIYALQNASFPLVIMDTDLLVWQSLTHLVGDNSIMAFHPETLGISCYLPLDLLKKPQGYVPDPKWDWNQDPVNTAITYYSGDEKSLNFVGQYSQSASKFMKGNTERPMEMISQMVFAEQRIYAMCAKKVIGKVPTFLAYESEEDKPFTHIWGNKALARDNADAHKQLCTELVNIIKTHFGDIAFPPKVVDIFNHYKQ